MRFTVHPPSRHPHPRPPNKPCIWGHPDCTYRIGGPCMWEALKPRLIPHPDRPNIWVREDTVQ